MALTRLSAETFATRGVYLARLRDVRCCETFLLRPAAPELVEPRRQTGPGARRSGHAAASGGVALGRRTASRGDSYKSNGEGGTCRATRAIACPGRRWRHSYSP